MKPEIEKTICPIVDTTLRDGEQASDVVFVDRERDEIFDALVDIGVREIELSITRMAKSDFDKLRNRAGSITKDKVKLIAWCRARKSDVETALRTSADIIHISAPTSDLHRQALCVTDDEITTEVVRLIDMIKSSRIAVSVGAQDATRANPLVLKNFVTRCSKAGAVRTRLADTVGISHPKQIQKLIGEMLSEFPKMEFEFHGHNDFGMATANSVAALEAGAHRVSTTLLGIGERAGNAVFECVASAIEQILNRHTGIDLSKLNKICKLVSKAARREISTSHPIVGEGVFSHESGIHTHGQLYNARCFEPFNAETVGHSPSIFLFGKNTGRTSVRKLLLEEGYTMSEEQIDRITRRLRKVSQDSKSIFTKDKIIADINNLLQPDDDETSCQTLNRKKDIYDLIFNHRNER